MRIVLAVLLLLVPVSAFGQAPQAAPFAAPPSPSNQPREQFFRQYDLTGGMNTKASPYSIADNEATAILNMTFDTSNAPAKRPGYASSTVVDATLDHLTSLYRFYHSNGNYYDIAHAGTVLYSNTNGGAWSSMSISVTVDTPIFFETFQDKVYLANGTDNIRSFDGTTATIETSFPAAGKYLRSFKNRLFMSGVSASKNTVYFSGSLAPTDWTSSDAGDFSLASDGDTITGLQTVGPFLVVFRRNSIYRVQGPDTDSTGASVFSAQQAAAGVGCISDRSLVRMDDSRLFFLARRGVFTFDGQDATLVSYKVGPSLDLDGDELGLNYKRQYWLVQFGADTNEMVFDVDTGVWSKYNGIPINCGFNAAGGSDDGKLYLGLSNDDPVFQFGEADLDNGEAISCSFTTKNYDLGQNFLDKRFRHLLVDVETETAEVTVDYTIDRGRVAGQFMLDTSGAESLWADADDTGETYLEWDTNNWSGGVFSPQSPFVQGSTGKSIQLTFSSDVADATYKIFGFSLRYAMHNHRGSENQ